MIKTKKIISQLGGSLFALIFVIGFGGGGWFAGIVPMANMLHGWWRAGDLVAVQASIDKLALREHQTEDGRSYSVDAEFVYQYNGKTYRSKRINVGGDSGDGDGAGGYNQRIHASLLQARSNDQQVTVWMDIKDPAFAVYDRQLRTKQLLFHIPFATLFPAVGLGALWALWAIWFKRDEDDENTPGLSAYTSAQSQSGWQELNPAPSGAGGLGLFALFWNLISFPIAGIFMLNRSEGGYWQYLVLLFPALGVLMIAGAVWLAYSRWRVGKPRLTLAKQPHTGIENLSLRLHFDPPLGQRMATGASHYMVKAEIHCEHEDRRGEDTTTKRLWEQTLGEQVVMHGAQSMDFTISLPADMPASGKQEHKDIEVIWNLQLNILGADLLFKLPVQQGLGEKANARDLIAKQYRSHEQRIYGLPKAATDNSNQTRRSAWFFAIFFIPAVASVFFIFDLNDLRNLTGTSSAGADNVAIETLAQLKARLDAGGDVNARDASGRSLLMQAADDNDIAKVRYLLQKGAQVDLMTPVDADGNGGRSALFAAIHNDGIEIVKMLADAGADLSRPGNKVWTPAHYAAYKGALKSLRYLHERGVAMDQTFDGGRGSTPLMIAAQYNQLDVISFLQLAGADRSKKDLYGEDACGYARYFKQAQAAAALGCP
ncbi:ankyrin repeat domain-containing protein [Undibacterium sp. YM2]|uniref:ankyrin repeat domain-containing protein n=1 Tax=Undibacterium sp. YM2 TaxID=2058625 RepID=UPI0013898F99|nr:ankyrin repeat domain-containing protein [Undibacterium sp. YM2]